MLSGPNIRRSIFFASVSSKLVFRSTTIHSAKLHSESQSSPDKTIKEAALEMKQEGNSKTLEKITKDNSYMSFFQSYSESATANKKMKSVEETKSFNKMFQYLLQSKGTGGVTPALQDLALLGVNVDLTDKDFTSKRRNEKFSLTGASTENALEAFKENSQNNQSVMEQLMPTLQYIETNINNTQEMFDFIQVKLIDRFSEMHSQSNEKPILSQTLEKTEQASLSDPSSPYMDIYTLPVLLQYCFNSLTYDFDSLEETLLFVDNIKKHNSVFVYEFGFNINVYNSLITQAWDKTKNLGLIGRLVDELKINAIQPNLLTFKVLSEIYLKCMSVNDGLAAEPYLLWGDSGLIYKVKDYLKTIKI